MSLLSAKKLDWTNVELPLESVANDESFQFLSAFEEISDYSIDSSKQLNFGGKPEKKVKKRRSGPQKIVGVLKKKPRLKLECIESKEALPKEDLQPEASCTNDAGISWSEEYLSWNTFGLSEKLMSALKALKFKEPTPIQKMCLPPAIFDKLDILGAAETGSGKTLAFALPILQSILDTDDEKDAKIKALILTPTRELAIQIKNHICDVAKFTDIKVSVVVGGLSVQKQERLLKKCPDILVATPGRLWAIMKEITSEYLNQLPSVKYLVVDEVDRMVEKGHFQELYSILDYLNKSETASKRQTFVFSATLAYVHPAPKRIASKQETKQMTPEQKIDMLVTLMRLRDARKVIDLTRVFGTAESLVETRVACDNLEDKDACLYYFLVNYPGRTIVFTNSVDSARRLKNLLSRLSLQPMILNAQMHQKQRLKNLEKFSEAESAVLLATDVAARGLDIKNIDHVIHYQVPRTTEVYVHRSGRTARALKQGLSVMLIDKQDGLAYRKICQNLNRNEDLAVFPMDSKLLRFLRERTKIASQLESLEHRVSKTAAQQNWFKKAAIEAEIEEDDYEKRGIDSDDETVEANLNQKRTIKSLSKKLQSMLKQALPRDAAFSTRYPTSVEFIRDNIASGNLTINSKQTALEVAKKNEDLSVASKAKKKLSTKRTK